MTTRADTSTMTLAPGTIRSQLQGSRTEFPCAVGRHLHTKTNWSKERFEQWRIDTFKGSCANSPFYRHDDGHQYCILHLPNAAKEIVAYGAFTEAIKARLENQARADKYNFRGVWFPSFWHHFEDFEFDSMADFQHATFNGSVSFRGATFADTTSFRAAIFNGDADFTNAHFKGFANFFRTVFPKPTIFHEVTFEKRAVFNFAQFSAGAVFYDTTFCGEAAFNNATFREYALFVWSTFMARVEFFADKAFNNDAGPHTARPYVCFHLTKVNDPASFSVRNGTLHPSWFINVDGVRTLNFSEVKWCGVSREPGGGLDRDIEILTSALDKVKALGKEHKDAQKILEHISFGGAPPNLESNQRSNSIAEQRERRREQRREHKLGSLRAQRALASTYRELAINAEENSRFEQAADFRRLAAEAQRKQNIRLPWKARGFAPWRISWWHWALSGHSENPLRAFIWLLVIWIGFAALYTQGSLLPVSPDSPLYVQMGFGQEDKSISPLSVPHAAVWSLGTMSRLVEGPSFPLTPAAEMTQAFVFLEGILGPLQFALLALAIRRRVMR
jgi:hypothetical protein